MAPESVQDPPLREQRLHLLSERFMNYLLCDGLHLVYPTLAMFSYCQYTAMDQSSGFAVINYIISIVVSGLVTVAVLAAAYMIYRNHRARATREAHFLTAAMVAEYHRKGEVSLYRGPFVLLRRLAFCIALGLYPDVGIYCLLISSFIYTLSIVSISLFMPYSSPLKNYFIMLFEALTILTLMLILALFLADSDARTVVGLSWAVFVIVLLTILLAVAFLVYELVPLVAAFWADVCA